ncbi:uncharacterized protein LOC142631462 [Castanea sativa]|uniref:uncharacterized protein LOC142631462 n=1 Tax=Castanea sativa TaxID=21020 RepID=UPI003F651EED
MLVQEFLDLCSPASLLRGSSAQVCWSQHLEGVFKVNFDVALFENIGGACIGVAIRDSKGEIIVALSQRIPLPFSVEMAEAMAVRRALLFAQELSLSKVMMEGDCLRVVLALNFSVSCNTLYVNVVEEARRQACQFQFCRFIHVR